MVTIVMTGISTFGYRSIASCRYDAMPSVTSASIMTVANTGRLIERFERNMTPTPPRPPPRP